MRITRTYFLKNQNSKPFFSDWPSVYLKILIPCFFFLQYVFICAILNVSFLKCWSTHFQSILFLTSMCKNILLQCEDVKNAYLHFLHLYIFSSGCDATGFFKFKICANADPHTSQARVFFSALQLQKNYLNRLIDIHHLLTRSFNYTLTAAH